MARSQQVQAGKGGHHNGESDNGHGKCGRTKSGLHDTVHIKNGFSRKEGGLEQVKKRRRSVAWLVLTKAKWM